MKAQIVIGLGYGDEGKGITTDFLCSRDPSSIVIRFSGGHQAGHTVVTDGKRHVFASYGSGTFRGCPTYISEYCVFYPPNIYNEYLALYNKGVKASLYIHPLARLTSPQDVAWGRVMEMINNHGSCGMGVGATMSRHEGTPYKLFAVDLFDKRMLKEKLHAIEDYYRDRLKELGEWKGYFEEHLRDEMRRFFSLPTSLIISELRRCMVGYDFLGRYENLVFEGSQGVMLDMEHGVFPNVTYSSTTSKNAMSIINNEIGISNMENVDIFNVTRCYQTRHGKGWMSSHQKVCLINNEEETNVHNDWQKDFRVAEVDYSSLKYALKVDQAYSWGFRKHLIVTCLDQRPDFNFKSDALNTLFASIYHSHSPDSKDFKLVHERTPVRLLAPPALGVAT